MLKWYLCIVGVTLGITLLLFIKQEFQESDTREIRYVGRMQIVAKTWADRNSQHELNRESVFCRARVFGSRSAVDVSNCSLRTVGGFIVKLRCLPQACYIDPITLQQ
jgi:hypothetical protein